MAAITIVETIAIERPAPDVWAVIADYRADPAWRHGVATMAPDPAAPVQVGTRTAEELRFAGRTRRNRGEVVAVTPGHAFRWRSVEGTDAHGSRTVEPNGAARCRLRLELVVQPAGFERVLAPILGPLLRRTLKGDLARLRAFVEGRTDAPVEAIERDGAGPADDAVVR